MTTPEHFISELKRIILTSDERSAMREKLHTYSSSHIPMQGLFTQTVQWFARHSIVALASAVILVGGVASVSANFAQPGDALYGFRTEVNDRVRVALAFDDDAKLDIEIQQMQRMIEDEDSYRDEGLSIQVKQSQESEARDNESESKNDSLSDENKLQDDDFNQELISIERELKSEDSARIELEL